MVARDLVLPPDGFLWSIQSIALGGGVDDYATALVTLGYYSVNDNERRARVAMFSAATGALVQTKVRTARPHALRRLMQDLKHSGFFKAALLAVDIGCHPFKGQRPFNKHHLAVGPMGNTLCIHVERLDVKHLGTVGVGLQVARRLSISRHIRGL